MWELKQALTTTGPCWLPVLGYPDSRTNLQQYISGVCKLPSLCYFVEEAWTIRYNMSCFILRIPPGVCKIPERRNQFPQPRFLDISSGLKHFLSSINIQVTSVHKDGNDRRNNKPNIYEIYMMWEHNDLEILHVSTREDVMKYCVRYFLKIICRNIFFKFAFSIFGRCGEWKTHCPLLVQWFSSICKGLPDHSFLVSLRQ